MDLPFLYLNAIGTFVVERSFNPYSNGSSFFIFGYVISLDSNRLCFNPYSNGSSFFINYHTSEEKQYGLSFNPYSNGSSFFIKK